MRAENVKPKEIQMADRKIAPWEKKLIEEAQLIWKRKERVNAHETGKRG